MNTNQRMLFNPNCEPYENVESQHDLVGWIVDDVESRNVSENNVF